MEHIIIKTNSNTLELKSDILLNKDITNLSKTNMYDILFGSNTFNEILNEVLKTIENQTLEDFTIIVKNLWGYIQTNDDSNIINIGKKIIDGILPISKYSFILLVESNETKFHLKSINGLVSEVTLNVGEILIFKTENFISDVSNIQNRIALIGSITNDIGGDIMKKSFI
jgi:hypothetical protein